MHFFFTPNQILGEVHGAHSSQEPLQGGKKMMWDSFYDRGVYLFLAKMVSE